MYDIFRLRPEQIFSFTWNPFAAKSVYWVAAADENDKEYFLDIPIEMAPWTAYNVTCGHKVRRGFYFSAELVFISVILFLPMMYVGFKKELLQPTG